MHGAQQAEPDSGHRIELDTREVVAPLASPRRDVSRQTATQTADLTDGFWTDRTLPAKHSPDTVV